MYRDPALIKKHATRVRLDDEKAIEELMKKGVDEMKKNTSSLLRQSAARQTRCH